jgi:hypothetical protein
MDQDMLDKLASGEYSISPRTGRIRKRVKVKKKKPFFQQRKIRKILFNILWIVLITGFIISLILVLPELNIVSDKKKENIEKSSRGK